jgi:hypothetical protein
VLALGWNLPMKKAGRVALAGFISGAGVKE